MLKMLAAFLIVTGLCGTGLCQYSAGFSSYHEGKRYDFRLTHDELAKTPVWNDDEVNPPLSVRQAKVVGIESLKHLFRNAEQWTLNEITLRPVDDRWVYTISFTEPPPPNCRNCLASPFTVVVRMDGVAVPAIVSPWQSADIKTATLLKRTKINGVDNYPYAAYSFKFGGNGPDIQKVSHNNWDILFGNSPEPDSFDVSIVTDDRSRIRDLGKETWAERFRVPSLPAYEEPAREPSVKAIEGHVYLVHSRDADTDLYALFRVEKLIPGQRVDITWKLIPKPSQ